MTRFEDIQLRPGLRVILILIQVAGILFLTYERFKWNSNIPAEARALIIMDILCMVIASAFSLSMIRSKKENKVASVFLLLVFFDVMHLFSDGIFRMIDGNPDYRIWNIVSNIIYLICPLAMTFLYWTILDGWMDKTSSHYKRANITIMIITTAGILLAIGSSVFGYYYVVGEDGVYHRGKLYILTIIIPLIPIMLCLGRILKSRLPLIEKLVLLSYPAIPIIAAVAQYQFHQSAFVTVATFLSLVLIYTNFLSMKEDELAQMQNQLNLSKLYLLQMQINPHMLFNTMSSIAGMCDIDPEKAQDMIFKLSDYLRDNFTDIYKPTMITLREELDNLNHYMAIETMRFPNISVVKDIKKDDFMLPRMSLQPLVENAIKHGICKRRNAEGTLKISSYETNDAWIVSVEDNGVGFDGKIPADIRDGHHGIYNVRMRLSILCNGSLEIEGQAGKGAISTIKIPKGGGSAQLIFK